MRGNRVGALVLAVVIVGVFAGIELAYGRTVGRSVACVFTAASPDVQRGDVAAGAGYIESSDACRPCMVRVTSSEHIVLRDDVVAEVVLPCGERVDPGDYLAVG